MSVRTFWLCLSVPLTVLAIASGYRIIKYAPTELFRPQAVAGRVQRISDLPKNLPTLACLTGFHGDVRQVITNRAPIHFAFGSDRVLNASSFTNMSGPLVIDLKEVSPDRYWMTVTPLP